MSLILTGCIRRPEKGQSVIIEKEEVMQQTESSGTLDGSVVDSSNESIEATQESFYTPDFNGFELEDTSGEVVEEVESSETVESSSSEKNEDSKKTNKKENETTESSQPDTYDGDLLIPPSSHSAGEII